MLRSSSDPSPLQYCLYLRLQIIFLSEQKWLTPSTLRKPKGSQVNFISSLKKKKILK